jgi:hypothetical protein
MNVLDFSPMISDLPENGEGAASERDKDEDDERFTDTGRVGVVVHYQ